MEPNDRFLLETILGYCEDVSAAIKRFNITESVISEDLDMRAMLAFFVQQIGETANKLSEAFKNEYPEIEWGAIVGMRNRIVHAYGKIIPVFLWDATTTDVPELDDFCRRVLGI